jgi:hypothetical protein
VAAIPGQKRAGPSVFRIGTVSTGDPVGQNSLLIGINASLSVFAMVSS